MLFCSNMYNIKEATKYGRCDSHKVADFQALWHF